MLRFYMEPEPNAEFVHLTEVDRFWKDIVPIAVSVYLLTI